MHMESTLGGGVFTAQGRLSGTSTDGGRPDETIDKSDPTSLQAHFAALLAENQELRAQLEQARTERSRMADILSQLTEVLRSKSPDKLVHDVRNVLNERELYRALADSIM
jgi:hypothetical protein